MSWTEHLSTRRHVPAWPGFFLAVVWLSLPRARAADSRPPEAKASEPPPAASSGIEARPLDQTPAEPDEEYKATRKIPKKLLKQVLGCWQLEEQERWTIARLDVAGAQVVTKLLKRPARPPFPDRVRRAAVPATLMYDARRGNFGFATAGKYQPTLVVFKQSGATLEASLYSKRTGKDRYRPTGNTAVLHRCKTRARSRPAGVRAPTPPRLK
jgi:hypothetical protein